MLSIQITACIWEFQRGGGDIAPLPWTEYGHYIFFGVKILDTKSILENEICEALLIILRMKEIDADFTVSGRQLPLKVLLRTLGFL